MIDLSRAGGDGRPNSAPRQIHSAPTTPYIKPFRKAHSPHAFAEQLMYNAEEEEYEDDLNEENWQVSI